MLTSTGKEIFGQMVAQGDSSIIAPGANFYIGACKQIPDVGDTLVSITTEPNFVNNYSRVAIPRNVVGFPTVDTVNGAVRILSQSLAFLAVGGDFDKLFDRLFVCDVPTGFVGNLIGYSGAYSMDILVQDGVAFDFKFELYP